MQCRQCGTSLERPGDYCLVCETPNADTVVLVIEHDRATVTALFEEAVISQRVVTTTPEPATGEADVVERRNFAGLIADEVRRKRPEAVYATGERDVLQGVREQLRYEFYRVAADDPVEHVIERRDADPLEVVEAPVSEKLGGSHSTVIGGRAGRRALAEVAEHPHVKKIVPGPIDASGSGSRSGPRVKATRADGTGNVRLLVRDGSSVQEVRVVTTAPDRRLGEAIRTDLNEALAAADLAE